MKQIGAMLIAMVILLCGCQANITNTETSATDENSMVAATSLYSVHLFDQEEGAYTIPAGISIYQGWLESEENNLFDPMPSDSVDVFWGDEEIHGDFMFSVIVPGNTYQSNFYAGENALFSVNASSGLIDTYSVNSMLKGSEELSFEEAERIAITFAEQYIDVSEYRIETEEKLDDLELPRYDFHFRRYYEDIPIWSCMDVCISIFGEIVIFSNNMTSELSLYVDMVGEEVFSEKCQILNSESAHMLIDESIKAFEPESYQIIKQQYVLLKEGNIGLVYEAELYNKEGEEPAVYAIKLLLTENGVIE